jgi:toxin ParE1/3/4
MTLRVSPLAQDDLQEIWEYIAEGNEGAADRVIDEITDSFQKLLQMPDSGRVRNDLMPGLRSLVASKPYVIFYRVEDSVLLIAQILHGMRDLNTIFHEGDA